MNFLSLTLSAGYIQISDKHAYVTDNSMPCTDLIFCTNQNAMSVKYGITVFKILKNLLKTLIGEKLLNIFL